MKRVQEVMCISTVDYTLNGTVEDWDREPLRYVPTYPSVTDALGDGWRLLAPPAPGVEGGWDWWFVRSVVDLTTDSEGGA